MKTLHLLASNSYAGAEHVAMTIIKGLQDKHDFVDVSPEGSIRGAVESENIMNSLDNVF